MSSEEIQINPDNVKFALRVLTEFDWVKIFNDLMKNQDLQQRIGNAIEYIKTNEFYLDYKTGACIKGVMPLLNILQGENKDEN